MSALCSFTAKPAGTHPAINVSADPDGFPLRTILIVHHKPNLPSKICAACARAFSWRRKWSRCWDEVKYCSDRCRRNRGKYA
ncbi:MAG: DUF2256 domain-containing protein [Alphaproteobacteria bacterium]